MIALTRAEQFEVVLGLRLLGHSMDMIATELGISAADVRAICNRARETARAFREQSRLGDRR